LILSFDLDASLRRLKRHKNTAALTRRDDSALTSIDDVDLVGPDLLIDTTVTVDVVQNRAPLKVDQLLAARAVHHSTVALSELTYLFGRLDPKHPDTAAAQRAMKKALDGIPDHRLTALTPRISGEAGIPVGDGRPADQSLAKQCVAQRCAFALPGYCSGPRVSDRQHQRF
jgi:hypothetical protein